MSKNYTKYTNKNYDSSNLYIKFINISSIIFSKLRNHDELNLEK